MTGTPAHFPHEKLQSYDTEQQMSHLILHENQMAGNEIVMCVVSAKILPVQQYEEAEHY